MKTNSNSNNKTSAKLTQKIRKRKSVVYRNQENSNNISNQDVSDCEVVRKCIKFEREMSLNVDKDKLIFSSFEESSQFNGNIFNISNHVKNSSQTGPMMVLFQESMMKQNAYLRFDDNESNNKRQKFI